ncbi:MAG TPA: CpaF family protein, partial [Anaerolineae bacterium]|nr:CpaF family protein [Anaerolineae bacterium]
MMRRNRSSVAPEPPPGLDLVRPVAAPLRSTLRELKTRIQAKLVAELDADLDLSDTEKVRQSIEETYNAILEEENVILNRTERARLLEWIIAEILGYGPIQPLLEDDTVTEIMINGPKNIYIERRGKISKTSLYFDSDEHLLQIIDRIVAPIGRRIDESSPMVDARLPDGSRVNAIIPPLSLVGPCLTIRKFAREPYTADDLIRFGTLTPDLVEFLKACVEAKLNIVISGGSGSGKTTLLNVISAFIPHDERIITIEDAAELQLKQEHVVRLEARPPNIEGKGEITIRQLVINALRMRPDRIIVGEVRGGEALD